jgi:hypothetical protein
VNRLATVLILFFAANPSPDIRYFRYHRPVQNTSSQPGQTCLIADAPLFTHSAPGLADLRLYRDRLETPYLIQTSAPVITSEQTIPLLNLGLRAGQTVFDAAMPGASYSDLQLKLTGQDFIATVAVTGSQDQSHDQSGKPTSIGIYTVFDLTRQRLGRSTVLHLPTSDFRYLHFRISGPIPPENVTGISVSQTPASKPKYVTVAESSQVILKGQSSIVEFTIPARVPIDRIEIVPPAAPANFSRAVHVAATPILEKPATESIEPSQSSSSFGSILRVHTVQNARHIDEESLALDPPRTWIDAPAKWTITIDNGDDAPLKPASVRILMLERDLCFDAAPSSVPGSVFGPAYTLYYGDAALASPRYDYAALFAPQPDAARATAGPEQPNPEFQPRPDDRPFTERHPALLWIALALVIAILGLIALRTAKSVAP